MTTADLCALLVARGADPAAGLPALVTQARAPRHKLAVTLLGAIEEEHGSLDGDQTAELAAHHRRIDRYRDAWAVVRAEAPAAYVVKGTRIAALYPSGLLRAAGDLDVVCREPDQLWAAARRLIGLGWEISAFTIVPARGAERYEVLLEVQRFEDEDVFGVPYGVELRTVDVATSIRERAYRLREPERWPVATNLVALLAEGWERPFTSRDVFDFALLTDELAGDAAGPGPLRTPEADALARELDRTGLWPQWRQLCREAARVDGRPAPRRLPRQRARTLTVRARRACLAVGRRLHPVRLLAYRAQSTVESDAGPWSDRVSAVLHERIGVHRVLRLGIPLFGVPLAGEEPAGSGPLLVRRGRQLIARTPVGSFLMVSGGCRSEWLAAARPPADGAR